MKNIPILTTLKTNWRDILTASIVIVAFAFLADVIERISITDDGMTWLTNVVAVISGLARLAGANLACWFIFAIAWPTVNKWINLNFKMAWEELSNYEKFTVFIVVSCVQLIAAAICFSA